VEGSSFYRSLSLSVLEQRFGCDLYTRAPANCVALQADAHRVGSRSTNREWRGAGGDAGRMRGRAQRAVETGRWMDNRIEDRPGRVKVRETGALKSAGRVAIAVRFQSEVGANGITIGPLDA
jgi:hypothetical protein